MKKVYFVRHGESESNAGGIIKSNEETILTKLGHEQAKFVGERAKRIPLDIIISSTLVRARQTAQHIVDATGLPLDTLDLIIERRYPSFQIGLTTADPAVKVMERDMIERFGDSSYRHSDEETFDEFKDRTIKTFEYLEARPEENILIVTHGIFLRMIIAAALFGKDLSQEEAGKVVKVFKTKNTGITLLEYDKENTTMPWSVRIWNDHSHLG